MTPEKEREIEKRLLKIELQNKRSAIPKKSRDQEKQEIKKALQKKFSTH